MDKNDLDNDLEKLMAEALKERDSAVDDSTNEDNSSEQEDNTNTEKEEGSKDDNDSVDNEEHSEQNSEEENSDKDESEERESGNEEFTSIEVEVDGQKVSLDSIDELKKFASSKNSNIPNIAKQNVIEEYAKQGNLSETDLSLLADIKAGKPGALKKLAKESGIDLVEADESDDNYNAEFKPKVKSDVELVIDSIVKDNELSSKFDSVTKNVPDEFLQVIASNAQDLQAFAQHVKSGLAEELLPLAAKETALNGGTLLENYIKLGESRTLNSKKNTDTEKKQSEQKREISEKEKELRERAKENSGDSKERKGSSLSVDEIWDMSPEELAKIDLRELAEED